MLNGLISLFMLGIVSFSFFSSLTSYCIILIFNSLCCLFIIIGNSGFSWYAILFYLVYVGGVYVLFIFLSVFLPNNLNNFYTPFITIMTIYLLIFEVFMNYTVVTTLKEDTSFNFCNSNEGFFYLFLSVFLLVGFICISFLVSSKESYIR